MSEIFNLDKNILESAKISACKINDKTARIRTYALNIAANATAQYLDSHGLQSDTSISLYKIPSFEQDFEVADVYVKGFRLDVRISFDGKIFTIPKLHEKYSVQPLAYIVVKLDEKLEKVEFLGFAPTEGLQCPPSGSEYYTLSVDVLKPMEALKELIESSTLNIHPYSANNHEKIKELCVPFMDGEISESEKVFFIKHVLACPVCRETFCDVNDFDTIISQIRNYQELLNDSTLSVLSGNKKEVNEAVLANMTLVENAEENTETFTEELEELAEEQTEEPFLAEEQDETLESLETDSDDSMLPEEMVESISVVAPVPVVESVVAPLEDLPDPDMLSSVNLELSQDDDVPVLEEVTDELLVDSEEEKQQDENREEPKEEPEAEPENEPVEEPVEESIEALEEAPLTPLSESDESNELSELGEVEELTESEPFEIAETEPLELSIHEEPTPLLEEAAEPESDSHIELHDDNEETLSLLEEASLTLEEQTEPVENTSEPLSEIEPLESLSDFEPLAESALEDDLKIEEHEELHELQEEELSLEHNEPIIKEAEPFVLDELETLEPLHEEETQVEEPASIAAPETLVEQEPAFEFKLEGEEEAENTLEDLSDDSALEEIQEETLEEIKEEVKEQSVVEPAKNPYIQEPVELKYDDEEDEEITELEGGEGEEPEEDEEGPSTFNFEQTLAQSADEVEEISRPVEQEQPVSAENAENVELQSLLDADLMALLSDDDSVGETQETVAAVEEPVQESVPAVEEAQAEEVPQGEVQADENIESLFENNEKGTQDGTNPQEFELAKEPLSEEAMKKTKRVAIMAGLLVVLMAAGGGMLFVNHQKATNNNNDTASGDQLFDFTNKGAQDSENAQGVSQDINRSMTNSFSDKPAAITITKLSWQVSEKLALDPSVKEYLQTAGKNIQMNLQNDLSNSADVAFNNSVKVSFTIAPDNTMKGLQVLESSGSDKIDEAISKSIKNTLKYISVPKIKNHNSDYFLTLIINF